MNDLLGILVTEVGIFFIFVIIFLIKRVFFNKKEEVGEIKNGENKQEK